MSRREFLLRRFFFLILSLVGFAYVVGVAVWMAFHSRWVESVVFLFLGLLVSGVVWLNVRMVKLGWTEERWTGQQSASPSDVDEGAT